MVTSSCYETASHISCDAMGELALKELNAERDRLTRLLDDSSCLRYQSMADRGLESHLQKGFGLSKNSCFTKTQQFNAGPWEKQVLSVATPTFFEKWTRARNNSKLQCGPPREICLQGPPIDACVWGNNGIEKCGTGCEPLTCVMPNSTGRFPCPPKCGTHPLPCPNPIGYRRKIRLD
jgi:hypothetical protein